MLSPGILFLFSVFLMPASWPSVFDARATLLAEEGIQSVVNQTWKSPSQAQLASQSSLILSEHTHMSERNSKSQRSSKQGRMGTLYKWLNNHTNYSTWVSNQAYIKDCIVLVQKLLAIDKTIKDLGFKSLVSFPKWALNTLRIQKSPRREWQKSNRPWFMKAWLGL